MLVVGTVIFTVSPCDTVNDLLYNVRSSVPVYELSLYEQIERSVCSVS